MAFFLSGLKYEGVMVAGWRDGISKANKPYVTVTVTDTEGNVNTLSTSEPATIDVIHTLKQGDVIDMDVVAAGGPKKQYAMIARGANSVRPHGVQGY